MKQARANTSNDEPGGSTGPQLSPDDRRHLDGYEKKLQLIRDRVGAVVGGYATGFFLDGPGGVSKSFTVLQELQRLHANYRLSNSRVTGRGLFDTLAQYPDAMRTK